jgi:hypothetical protein
VRGYHSGGWCCPMVKHLDLYDMSGPYTDPDMVIDLSGGLPGRPGMVRDRGTQLQRARAREITAETAFIAEREVVPAEVVRSEVARGRAVIPANHRRPKITRILRTRQPHASPHHTMTLMTAGAADVHSGIAFSCRRRCASRTPSVPRPPQRHRTSSRSHRYFPRRD